MSRLITFFLMPLAFLLFFILPFGNSTLYEYILLLGPVKSLIGLPAASSLNLPITFLFSSK